MDRRALAQALQKARLERGWNKTELARLAGCSDDVITRAEAGRNVNPEFWVKMRTAFGMDFQALSDSTDPTGWRDDASIYDADESVLSLIKDIAPALDAPVVENFARRFVDAGDFIRRRKFDAPWALRLYAIARAICDELPDGSKRRVLVASIEYRRGRALYDWVKCKWNVAVPLQRSEEETLKDALVRFGAAYPVLRELADKTPFSRESHDLRALLAASARVIILVANRLGLQYGEVNMEMPASFEKLFDATHNSIVSAIRKADRFPDEFGSARPKWAHGERQVLLLYAEALLAECGTRHERLQKQKPPSGREDWLANERVEWGRCLREGRYFGPSWSFEQSRDLMINGLKTTLGKLADEERRAESVGAPELTDGVAEENAAPSRRSRFRGPVWFALRELGYLHMVKPGVTARDRIASYWYFAWAIRLAELPEERDEIRHQSRDTESHLPAGARLLLNRWITEATLDKFLKATEPPYQFLENAGVKVD